jgi:hypothetical protein
VTEASGSGSDRPLEVGRVEFGSQAAAVVKRGPARMLRAITTR